LATVTDERMTGTHKDLQCELPVCRGEGGTCEKRKGAVWNTSALDTKKST
jgi:hypothetical protein